MVRDVMSWARKDHACDHTKEHASAELRKVVYTTNAIESLNARFRRAVRHRGHFPTEQAAMKVLYLTAIKKRPNRQDLVGRMNGWKTILNTLTVHHGERITNHL